jgi:hypothetical protein
MPVRNAKLINLDEVAGPTVVEVSEPVAVWDGEGAHESPNRTTFQSVTVALRLFESPAMMTYRSVDKSNTPIVLHVGDLVRIPNA